MLSLYKMSARVYFPTGFLDTIGKEYNEMLVRIDKADGKLVEKRKKERRDDARTQWQTDDTEIIDANNEETSLGNVYSYEIVFGSLSERCREALTYIASEFVGDKKKRAKGRKDKPDLLVKCPACEYVGHVHVEQWDRENNRERGCHLYEVCKCFRRHQPNSSYSLVDHMYKLQNFCRFHKFTWWYLVKTATSVMDDPNLGPTKLVIYILEKSVGGKAIEAPSAAGDLPEEEVILKVGTVKKRSQHHTWCIHDYDTESGCESSCSSSTAPSRPSSPSQNIN